MCDIFKLCDIFKYTISGCDSFNDLCLNIDIAKILSRSHLDHLTSQKGKGEGEEGDSDPPPFLVCRGKEGM